MVCVSACTPGEESATTGERPLRISVAKLQHETCTFCPGGDVEVADWERARATFTDETLLESGNFVRGFTARAREYGNV